MAIILEGMDNSGKSTLAAKLATGLGLSIYHPGPAPKSRDEEQACFNDQLEKASQPVIMDRVTCISSQIYRNRLRSPRYLDWLRKMVITPTCIIVYCRPPSELVLDFSTHQVKAHDTPESLKALEAKATGLLQQYDDLMFHTPCVRYDYTKVYGDNLDEFVARVGKIASQPSEWMKWIGAR